MLTSEDPADPRIAVAFKRAVEALGERPQEAVNRQVRLYRDLDVLRARWLPLVGLFAGRPAADPVVAVAVGGAADVATDAGGAAPGAGASPERRTRVVVFSGHTIDGPDRPSVKPERFPARAVEAVGAELRRKLFQMTVDAEAKGETIVGFASGSSGGDLLFHDVCAALGIEREIFLTVPDTEFRGTAISPDPLELTRWLDRFNKALGQGAVRHVLESEAGLPSWRDGGPDDPLWGRWIRWVCHHAQVRADDRVTALVLWDGDAHATGRGVYGFMQAAHRRGFGVEVIELHDLVAAVSAPSPTTNDPAGAVGSTGA